MTSAMTSDFEQEVLQRLADLQYVEQEVLRRLAALQRQVATLLYTLKLFAGFACLAFAVCLCIFQVKVPLIVGLGAILVFLVVGAMLLLGIPMSRPHQHGSDPGVLGPSPGEMKERKYEIKSAKERRQ